MRSPELAGRALSGVVPYRKQHSRALSRRLGGNGRIELPHASSPVAQILAHADEALSTICNFLAFHPRITCAALLGLIELACQLDRYLP